MIPLWLDLTDAANLVEQILPKLESGKEPACSCCGVEKAKNWTQRQAHTELTGVVQKLRRWAHRLEREGV